MQRFGRRASAFYRVTLRACLNAPLIVFAVAAFFTAAGAFGFLTLKSELTPNEDRSQVMSRSLAIDFNSSQKGSSRVKLVRCPCNVAECLTTFPTLINGFKRLPIRFGKLPQVLEWESLLRLRSSRLLPVD